MQTYDVIMTPSDDGCWVLKSEVVKELRHSKRKRCLAMAQVLEHVCPITHRKARWQNKWYQRWLELAERFKEEAK